MKKVKVLHFFGRMNRGGAETLIMNVFRGIDREKFQFDFLVSSSMKGDYDEEIRKLGGNIYIIETPRQPSKISMYSKQLKELIHENAYDVVHSHVHFFSGIITKIAKEAGVQNIIAHSHNINDGKKSSFSRMMYRNYMRSLIMRNSNYLLSCSLDASNHLYKNTTDKRIVHINNGIDIKRFEDLKKPREELLKSLNIPAEAFVIGHIGRFDEQKNHEFLIDIFMEILNEKKDSYLVLIGRGKLEDKIKDKVAKLNIEKNVKFLGVREDIPEVLSAMDIFLFPSLFEGLGIVLIEAQAAGLPCFVSNTVPKEADMNAGLVKFISLNESSLLWSNTILQSNINKKENAFDEIISQGYSIDDTIDKIKNIYML